MNQAPTEDKPHSYKQIEVGLINQAPTRIDAKNDIFDIKL